MRRLAGLGLVLLVAAFGTSALDAGEPLSLAAQVHYLEITIPLQNGLNPATRPPVATYQWQTIAGSPDPAEVRWMMISAIPFNDNYHQTEEYIRNNPDAPEWSSWQTYAPPAGTSWTSPPMDFGRYVFAVQGRDGSGNAELDFSLDRNIRRVMVATRSTGPYFKVKGTGIDSVITTQPDRPPVEIELESGTPAVYCWTADASFYGGVVTGYRYGWDIADPNDDSQWEIPFTPFVNPEECSPSKTFTSGVHTFRTEVIDNDGYTSRVTIQITYLLEVPAEKSTWGRIKAKYGE